jgi:hypothetical protein
VVFNQQSLDRIGRFGIRALRIVASTIAIVAAVRGDWGTGVSGGLAWLLFVQVERNLPPAAEVDSDIAAANRGKVERDTKPGEDVLTD